MPDCKSCIHAIFCPTWGDYKCVKLAVRLKSDRKVLMTPCHLYEGRPKNFMEKPCRCEDCMSNTDKDI